MATAGTAKIFVEDLSAARGGDRDALGRLLETYRVYLLMIANREIEDDLRAKQGASDVVQDTLCEAHRGFPLFRGETEDELRAWLRRALRNNLQDLTRDLAKTLKRRVGAEVSLEATSRATLVDPRLTPVAQLTAREDAMRLEAALQRLPDEHRRVIDLRFHQDLPFASVGLAMGRSEDAARMLLFRAVERLQRVLEPSHDPDRRRAGKRD